MALDPFGSLVQQINALAMQQQSPQAAQLQFDLQQRIAEQTRQNLANEYLATTDFSRDPATSLRTLGAILNNTDLLRASMDYSLKQKAFEQQQRDLEELAGRQAEIGQFAEELAPEGFSPEEQAQLYGRSLATGVQLPSIPSGAAEPIVREQATDELRAQQQQLNLQKSALDLERKQAELEKLRQEMLVTPDQRMEKLAAAEDAKQRARARVKANASLGNIENIVSDLDNLFQKFSQIPSTYKGPIAGRTLGKAARELKGNPQLAAYEDFTGFVLANVSRQLAGERGVLTDADIQRIKDALPSLKDTDASAKEKLQLIFTFVDKRVREQQRLAGLPETGLEGYDLKGFSILKNGDGGQPEVDRGEVRKNFLEQNFPGVTTQAPPVPPAAQPIPRPQAAPAPTPAPQPQKSTKAQDYLRQNFPELFK